jgi:hypothetical protein
MKDSNFSYGDETVHEGDIGELSTGNEPTFTMFLKMYNKVTANKVRIAVYRLHWQYYHTIKDGESPSETVRQYFASATSSSRSKDLPS